MAEMFVPICKIDKIEEHPNADRLEVAFVDVFSWPIIVGKGTFNVGDICVYFPVDLVVDEKLEKVLVGDSKIKLNNARIRPDKKTIHLGCFENFEDAVLARYKAEVKLGWNGCNSTSSSYLYLKERGLV